MEKVYHIYAKNKCLFHSVGEDDFETTWDTLNNMVGIMKTEYSPEDLTYVELTIDKNAIRDSSH